MDFIFGKNTELKKEFNQMIENLPELNKCQCTHVCKFDFFSAKNLLEKNQESSQKLAWTSS